MRIVKININDLKPYYNNAKEHTDEQIEQIKNSIVEFGNNDPIAVDENNVIIEGHGRYAALKELGYIEVDCIILDGLTEEQKNAYRIVHNQLTMNTGWDLEKLKTELEKISLDMKALGLTEEMLDELESTIEVEEDDFNVDEALEEIEEPITKTGDLYKLGNHYLLCGDSTSNNDVLKLLQENKVDLFLTDPPYNVDYEGSDGQKIQNDNMSNEDFKQFLIKAFKNANEVMNAGASFYVWYASREAVNFENALNEIGLEVRQQLIWNKNTMTLGRQDYQWKHEPCLYGWKEGAAHYFIDSRCETTVIEDKPNINNMSKTELKEYIKELLKQQPASTIIYEDKPLKNADHPTMKPLKLMGYLIQNSSKKNYKVLDLFGGSGSTLIACEQLNRQCFTMELDPKYCDVIVKRWETLTGKKAVLLESATSKLDIS